VLEDKLRAIGEGDAELGWLASCQKGFWRNPLGVPRLTGRAAQDRHQQGGGKAPPNGIIDDSGICRFPLPCSPTIEEQPKLARGEIHTKQERDEWRNETQSVFCHADIGDGRSGGSR